MMEEDKKKMEEEQKKKEEEEKKKKEEEDANKDDGTHLCCTYATGMIVYGIFLWILGIFCILNICLIFGNMYMPVVYPLVSLFIVLFFFAGLILIMIWFCSENESTRTGTIWAGWLILGSIIALILWNVFYILNHNKHKKEGVKVGMGDDPDDYDEEDRSSYILGYLIWGLVIIVLDILFLYCAYGHADMFPPEESEEMMKMEEMMEKMEKMEKMEMMMDADMGAGEMAEGGQRERRAGSRSSSMRSTKSAKYMRNSQRGKAAPSATAYKN